MIQKITDAMIKYFSGDPKRIHHFLKVYAFASAIAKSEGVDARTLETIETAALTHDIGIRISEKKYSSSSGFYQQLEGPAEAKRLLTSLGVDKDIIDRVCYLISVHHTYTGIEESMDYRILIEADFLVNAYEDNLPRTAVKAFKNKNFKTKTGLRYIDEIFFEKTCS